MTRRLVFSYLAITAFVLLILEVPLGISFARNEEDRLAAELERDARVIATLAEDRLEGTSAANVQADAERYAAETGGRVVVVDRDGVSIADSDPAYPPGRDFSTRPEMAAALTGETASGRRHSDTLDTDLLYVSVPVASSGRLLGAVRVTFPTTKLDTRVRRNWLALGALAAVVLVAVAVVGTVLARSVTRPVRRLAGAADALGHGDLAARAPTDEGPPEVRALAGDFNAMAGRVGDLVAAQRSFVADASHELRTPLTALRLRLENLATDAPADLRPEVEAAGEEAARLARLSEGLLGLARADATTAVPADVDLAAEAQERVATWQPLAEEQGVLLALDAPHPVPARALPESVAQIVDNLLANALEVAPAGSTVTVRAVPGDPAEVHVVDAGPGLSPDQRARAFDRFWRAAGAGGRGSGIGLAIVGRLAAAAGGSAELREAPGGGIDATVRLPGRRAGASVAGP